MTNSQFCVRVCLCVCLCESSPHLHLRRSAFLLLCSSSFWQNKSRRDASSLSVSDRQGDNSTQIKQQLFCGCLDLLAWSWHSTEGFDWPCRRFHARPFSNHRCVTLHHWEFFFFCCCSDCWTPCCLCFRIDCFDASNSFQNERSCDATHLFVISRQSTDARSQVIGNICCSSERKAQTFQTFQVAIHTFHCVPNPPHGNACRLPGWTEEVKGSAAPGQTFEKQNPSVVENLSHQRTNGLIRFTGFTFSLHSFLPCEQICRQDVNCRWKLLYIIIGISSSLCFNCRRFWREGRKEGRRHRSFLGGLNSSNHFHKVTDNSRFFTVNAFYYIYTSLNTTCSNAMTFRLTMVQPSMNVSELVKQVSWTKNAKKHCIIWLLSHRFVWKESGPRFKTDVSMY